MYKRIFITHHKTGHHLCASIAKSFCEKLNLSYYDLSTAKEIPHDAEVVVYESSGNIDQTGQYKFASWGGDLKLQDVDFKGVHLIRHPYEVIASAYRWHQKIDKEWVNVDWEQTGMSYKEHLASPDGVVFEMKNLSKGVIMNMYSNNRTYTVKYPTYIDL